MIWAGGKIIDDASLQISVLDRTFEHGLGLFETFRTWNGLPVLLDHHLARMRNSAKILGIPLNSQDLPDASAIAQLIGTQKDVMLRLTATGGTATARSTVWLAVKPLPPDMPPEGIRVILAEVASEDLAKHKTLNYWSRKLLYEQALAAGAHECLRSTADGSIWSGSRTNVFVVDQGKLLTPPLTGPLIPGIMRKVVLDQARQLGIESVEENLSIVRLENSAEVFLTNSVRGIVAVANLPGTRHPAPGKMTRRLQSEISRWLAAGGIEA